MLEFEIRKNIFPAIMLNLFNPKNLLIIKFKKIKNIAKTIDNFALIISNPKMLFFGKNFFIFLKNILFINLNHLGI